jgi:hypothetical protein
MKKCTLYSIKYGTYNVSIELEILNKCSFTPKLGVAISKEKILSSHIATAGNDQNIDCFLETLKNFGVNLPNLYVSYAASVRKIIIPNALKQSSLFKRVSLFTLRVS